MRRLTQVRGADNACVRGAVRGCAVRSCTFQLVELNRVGQPRRGGRHQGHRVRLTARMLTADCSALGQYPQALAVGLAGVLKLRLSRAHNLLLRAFLKLGVESQLAGGGCGQISEGEGKVHGDFSAGGERNMTGVKPRRREWGQAPPEGGLSTPRHPSPRGVDFQVSRETLQKINLLRMIYRAFGAYWARMLGARTCHSRGRTCRRSTRRGHLRSRC